MRLTKTIVENLPLPEKGQRFIWDDDVRGFGVRLNPAGRTYVIQGRVKGVERRVSLGRHGVLTVQEARRKAQKVLADMLSGVDPVVEKRRSAVYSLTLRELANHYTEARTGLKETSKADILKHINKSFTAWADRPAVEITRDKVATLFRQLSERSPAQANQAFRILRGLLNYAQATYRPDNKPIIIDNPVRILSDARLWNNVKPRSNFIPTTKVGAAWNALQDLRSDPSQRAVGRTIADAVCFILLTGCRWSEMAQLTWDHVNLDEAWWHVADTKNRSTITFPLSSLTVAILRERPGKKETEWVFPGRQGKEHICSSRGILEKVAGTSGVKVGNHDLRRTFRAIAGECGVEYWKIKLLMGHKMSGDITIQHYTEKSDLRYLASDIERISQWVRRQSDIAGSEKVLPFPAKTKS